MPASRPSWKGYIKLALVSCPIGLWPATTSSERVTFRQINKKTGNRIRQESVDEATREPVQTGDRVKGYEIEKGSFLVVDDEELKAIEIESTRTIEIDSFVPRAEIDERFLDSPYYIAPNEPVGAEAFSMIRDAMRDENMVALARVVLSSRERIIMLQPWDKGMLWTTLRYPYELRKPEDYFYDIPNIKTEPELLRLAQHILQSKAASFDPSRFVDRYEQAVLELIGSKRKGMPNVVRPITAPLSTVDLMDALKRSLGKSLPPANDGKPAKTPVTPKAKKAKPRVEGQRELLLPISGGKAAAEPTKREAKASTRRKTG